jgi:hypothetical protein
VSPVLASPSRRPITAFQIALPPGDFVMVNGGGPKDVPFSIVDGSLAFAIIQLNFWGSEWSVNPDRDEPYCLY